MASQSLFTVTPTTLRKTSLALYPFALALGIPFTVEASAIPYSDQDPGGFCSISFVSMTFSFLFSLSVVCHPVSAMFTKILRDGDTRRKLKVYSIFASDLVLAMVLLASLAYTCARLPYFDSYYFISPRVLMLGTYATVTLMINMCIHCFFVVHTVYQKFPVDYGGYGGTRSHAGSHVHRDWTGRERVYRDVEGMSVGVTDTDQKRSLSI